MTDQHITQLDKNTFKRCFNFRSIKESVNIQNVSLHRHKSFYKLSKDYIESNGNDFKDAIFNDIRYASKSLGIDNDTYPQMVSKGCVLRCCAEVLKKVKEFYQESNSRVAVFSVSSSLGNCNPNYMVIDNFHPNSIQEAQTWINQKHNIESINGYDNITFTFILMKGDHENVLDKQKYIKENYHCGTTLSNKEDLLGYSYEISLDLNNKSKNEVNKIIDLFSNYKTIMKYKSTTQRFFKKNRKVASQKYKKPRSIRIYTNKISAMHKLKIAGITCRNITVTISQKGLKEMD